ncbi:MAG: relaxase domain-containing protein [Sneathiellales bacterium]|nr:relaxase domain-containing protein [Sneathiellales bacterium]
MNDYYAGKSQITGTWHGSACSRLDISGHVSTGDFQSLLNNINPATGNKLTARNSPNRRPMYDFTFNAPKSVSLVHAITGDQDILNAHQSAVLETMAAIEADMQTQAGTGKGKHYVTTGNIAFAQFVHTTSRPVKRIKKKTYAPDPHLHSHCAVINATWFEKQARFRAIEIGNIKAQGAYYEALYHSRLAKALKHSGYELMRTGKRWEIKGLDRALIEKFSGRTLEIEAESLKRGITSEKRKAQLGRMTRHKKDIGIDDDMLHEFWLEILSDDEYRTIITAKKHNDGGSDPDNPSPIGLIYRKQIVDHALDHMLERHSAVSEKKLLAYAIDRASGTLSAQEIREELASRSDIMSATINTVRYITTTAMEAEEARLITCANKTKNKALPLNPAYKIQCDYLNKGQRAAIDHVLTSKDQMTIIAGDAGVGKTTLLQEVKCAIEETGKSLFAFAPSSEASRGVLRSKGFDGAETVEFLLSNEAFQERLKDQVILIDEAGLISVPAMNRILDIAQKQNARLILSGDWKQHSAVERGDALKILETKSGLKPARVNEILRQRSREIYKSIIERIASSIGCKYDPDSRKKEMLEAFDDLDRHNHIQEIEDLDMRLKALARDYEARSSGSPDDVLVVAPTHREGRAITEEIRLALKASGRIEGRDQELTRLQSRHLSCAQKQSSASYEAGEIIEFHRNAKGFKAGSRYIVQKITDNGQVIVRQSGKDDMAALPLGSASRFEVYKPETIRVAAGDHVRITKNSKSLAGSALYNGQTYTVMGFDDHGNIKLSGGHILSKYAQHFTHGYVSTSHGSQGKDAKTVLIAQSAMSFAASNDKQFYVSVSRGVEECLIYTDDKASLKEAISQNGDRLSASEIAQAKADYEEKLEEEDNECLDIREWLHQIYAGIRNIFNHGAKHHGTELTQTKLDVQYGGPEYEPS